MEAETVDDLAMLIVVLTLFVIGAMLATAMVKEAIHTPPVCEQKGWCER